MNSGPPLICLIAAGHVASTPRLVKEADALTEAGYRVHVVFARSFPAADPLDSAVLRAARWSHSRVDASRGPGAAARKLLGRLARLRVGWARHPSLNAAARANGTEALHLGAVAARICAALYIGHSLPALSAAALAARLRGSAFGFDLEDYHDEETDEAMSDRIEQTIRRTLQSRLLAGCAHLTASSPLITRRYRDSYGVHPRTILNVFPRSFAPSAAVDPGPISHERPARVYWFSQTIGPGRGLDEVVTALGRMRSPVELHLRGFPAPGFLDHLRARAAQAKLLRPLRILPPGAPGEMARLASDAHLGLSTELRLPPNRDLCLTNKIFVYLLAGIPQLLSRTSAQAALAPELGEAALLADLDQAEAVAAQLDILFSAPDRMAAARRHATELAERRFCWDIEKAAFLDSVGRVVPLP
ncbi:MAG TPA: hypothetical protein VGF85_01800 [Opitutaceae bacterium]